MKYYKIQG